MERILNSFKALYKGEGVSKTHWLAALLFLLPCCASATFQFIDKDTKSLIVPLLIAGIILLVLSIVPLFMLSGFLVKFLNRRLSEPLGLPIFDKDCILKGLKYFPVSFVWCFYVGFPVLLYITAVMVIFGVYISSKPDTIGAILSVVVMICLLLLLFIPLFIFTPFVNLVNIKFSENFKYSSEIFNPLTPFRYMKKAFKETIIVALKFFVVSIVTSTAAQIVTFIGALFIFVIAFVAALLSPENAEIYKMPLFLVFVILFSGVIGVVSAYATWITGLACADNLVEVYKNKIMQTPEVKEVNE